MLKQEGDVSNIQCWPSSDNDGHSCAMPDTSSLLQHCSPSLFLQWWHPMNRHPVKALSCTNGMPPPTSICSHGLFLFLFLSLFHCPNSIVILSFQLQFIPLIPCHPEDPWLDCYAHCSSCLFPPLPCCPCCCCCPVACCHPGISLCTTAIMVSAVIMFPLLYCCLFP